MNVSAPHRLAVAVRTSCLAVALLPAVAAAQQPPSTTASATCPPENTVYANVVALDQPIMINRLGANLPGGMVFALARDVCAGTTSSTDDQTTCAAPGTKITPDNARLKPYKRPRPLVLRVNQGQCLQIGFTNLLTPTAPADYVQPSTRNASVHVQGLELVNTSKCGGSGTGPMCNDGSWVGNNASDLASSGLVPPAPQLDPVTPQITYTLYAANEGAFLCRHRDLRLRLGGRQKTRG